MLVKTLFDEIDVNGLGRLSSDDICTFLLSKHKAKEVQLAKVQLVQIKEPIKTCDFLNREQVARTIAQKYGGGFIVATTDGTLAFWSSNLKLTNQRSLVFEEQTQRLTPKWYTDFLFLNEISKFVSSTGIRPQGNQYVIAWGDSNGDVSILLLTDITELLRIWKVSSTSGALPTVNFEQLLTQPKVQFLRWHVHSEWVVKVHYEPSVDKIISCCNEETTAVVMAPSYRFTRTHFVHPYSNAGIRAALQAKQRLSIDQQVFRIYKGARTFAYSRDRNLLVTGGNM
ncbi:unnamed protein product [Schistocephalus solidus]|uniref:EF-hand domain-containing protein n=1 Tax=Schistocephalus solidus TaxID=70667 RepID=A0A183TCQ4_SCHSO|nr:unnamed protein product [Schistocephalus solidus]